MGRVSHGHTSPTRKATSSSCNRGAARLRPPARAGSTPVADIATWVPRFTAAFRWYIMSACSDPRWNERFKGDRHGNAETDRTSPETEEARRAVDGRRE